MVCAPIDWYAGHNFPFPALSGRGHSVAGLEPLTLTRPVFDLLLGATTLGSKIARAFGVGPGPLRRGAVIRPYLAAVQRQRDPHTAVNDRDWLARGPVLVVNGRWVPPAGLRAARCRTAPGWGSATASPPAPWSGPRGRVASTARGSTLVRRDRRRHGGERDRRRVDQAGPGTSSPATPTTWSATSRPRARSA